MKHLRWRRVNSYSPEAWRMVEHMQDRIDREHAWVHRLEDEIARLRDVIDEALIVCVHHPISGAETAARVADQLRQGQSKR